MIFRLQEFHHRNFLNGLNLLFIVKNKIFDECKLFIFTTVSVSDISECCKYEKLVVAV